jgi:hypothetical protein
LQKLIGVLAACAAAVVVMEAAAYDYSEHAFVSHQALLALERKNPKLAEHLSAVVSTTGGTSCPENRLVKEEAPEDCLVAADVPALNGDHSPSPVMTKWRWFDGAVEENQSSFLRAAVTLPFSVMGEDASPEEALVGKPNIKSMLEYRAPFATYAWGDDFERMSDIELLGIDRSYVHLAARGHPILDNASALPPPFGLRAAMATLSKNAIGTSPSARRTLGTRTSTWARSGSPVWHTSERANPRQACLQVWRGSWS